MTSNLAPRPSQGPEDQYKEYLGMPGAMAALKMFGDDLRSEGMFYTRGGSDMDVPFEVVSPGTGVLKTNNIIHGRDNPVDAGSQGLNGIVITEQEADGLVISPKQ